MQQQRMYFPDRAHTETDRMRDQRIALSKSVAKAVKDGTFTYAQPEEELLVLIKPSGELVMPLAAYKALDYPVACRMSGVAR